MINAILKKDSNKVLCELEKEVTSEQRALQIFLGQ